MLYVLGKEIESERFEWTVFEDRARATECFDEAAYVVRNAPGDGPGDDPIIVTAAFLYAADTSVRSAAETMARSGRATLIAQE